MKQKKLECISAVCQCPSLSTVVTRNSNARYIDDTQVIDLDEEIKMVRVECIRIIVTPLLLMTVINHYINIALYQSVASAGLKKSSDLKTWFKLLSGWIPRPVPSNNKRPPPLIESSFVAEEELRLASSTYNLRQFTYNNSSSSSLWCSVTLTSLESYCGRTCTHTTEYSASFYSLNPFNGSFTTYTKTFTTSYSSGCEQITAKCRATAVGALAVAAAMAIAVRVAAPAAEPNQGAEIQQQVAQFISSGGLFDTLTPVNNLPIPVPGENLPDDGCGYASVRFQDGRCYPVLKRGPCRNPYYWVTVDSLRLTGLCRPRLCGNDQVFVGSDGLCHDSEDPFACRGGRKLFYTAYGDPICDCPIGQYPFPGVQDDCVSLFTRGPCPLGQVVAISRTGNIHCTPSDCPLNGSNRGSNLPLARYKDGSCYVLGSQGPCRPKSSQLFGYDVFRRRSRCVNVTSFDSPYFVSEQENHSLNRVFNQISPDYNDFWIFLTNDLRTNQTQIRKRNWDATSIRRQEALTGGIFQLPSRLPSPQLNPCRPGAQNGNNLKCTNPLVSTGRKENILQAVRSAFECPNDSILQATGQCRNDAQGASCGPSYQFIDSIGQCRQIV